jgi:5-methyltetrahydrofolate--homocysteine methyltransferase
MGREMSSFLDALRSGRVLLMDGAMGTELQKRGLKSDEIAATWNVLHPDKVRAIHNAYRHAGAEVLLTNTFLINSTSYVRSMYAAGEIPSTGDWQRAFDLIGREARFRVAAVGPVAGDSNGREFDNMKMFFVPDHCSNFAPHACCHVPDAILLETCSSPRVRYALNVLCCGKTSCPILLSLTYQRSSANKLVTLSGHSPEWFAKRAKQYGADALGANCGRDIDMDDIIEIIRRYRAVTDLLLFARPNAGTPTKQGDRWIYPHTPKAMAARLPELLEAGVSMVGGCCGTTPGHIAAFREVIDAWNKRAPVLG